MLTSTTCQIINTVSSTKCFLSTLLHLQIFTTAQYFKQTTYVVPCFYALSSPYHRFINLRLYSARNTVN